MGISGLMSQIQTNTRKCPNKNRRAYTRLQPCVILLFFRTAPEHFICYAAAQLAYAKELFFHIRVHPVVQPVYYLSETLAFVELDYRRFIFIRYLHA